MKDEIIRQIEKLLSQANQMLGLKDYEDVLDEVASNVEGRLEGLKADKRESAE